jgi:class 3 adenylate cyclase
MIVLHKQTQNSSFQKQILESTRDTSVPALFQYETADGVQFYFPLEGGVANGTNLKNRDKVRVSVIDTNNRQSVGWFSYRDEQMQDCLTSIVATFFIIFVWFFGVIAFSGPVIVLVVTPIERMVRLLGMLMLDPLGYQSTSRFKRFLREEDDLVKGTRWTKDVLKGMETSFLMSTILRIGSLMKVGFGTAGVEIIRNNLRKGQSKNVLILDSEGSTVSCIFLFCDIRQFTDATECLQEEVFVFTNRIAAVVHSICHAYGGAANKNVGDAFLLSWSLEDSSQEKKWNNFRSSSELTAKNNQGDKALLSVIKICLSLYYDKNYLEPLSEVARLRLKDKLLRKRTGPVVQMGFGLHAGKAVQGAIGSQRKIDATYVSEAVKRAEFLESETKTYGLKLLMSGSFHSLLHPNTRRRCRKVDRVYIPDEDGEGDDEYAALELSEEDLIHLYTFDMDVGAIYRAQQNGRRQATIDAMSDTGSTDGSRRKIDRTRPGFQIRNRSKRSLSNRYNTHYAQNQISIAMSEEFLLNGNVGSQTEVNTMPGGASVGSIPSLEEADLNIPPELVLPKGPAFYSHKIWQSPDIGRMRDKYIRGNFFQKYQTALTAFYNGDWDTARKNFLTVLDSFDDGPSRYFMEQMKEHNGVPPRDFMPYRKY